MPSAGATGFTRQDSGLPPRPRRPAELRRHYFKGPEKRLVYPWAKGLKVEEIQAYYDEAQFKDWTHADTGAPVLKAQHPEFEMWIQRI